MSNQTLNNFIKQRADRVFYWWEDNAYDSYEDGASSHDKIFAFSDWMDKQSDDDLRDISGLDYAGKSFMTLLRREINKGINAWLDSNKLFII